MSGDRPVYVPPPEPEPVDEPVAYAPVAPSIPEVPAVPAQVSRPTSFGRSAETFLAERAGDSGAGGSFRMGQRVAHALFGEGVVMGLEGRGEHAHVQVNFEQSGAKWLVLAYAKLQSL